MKRETALRKHENLIKEAKGKFPDEEYKVLLGKARDLLHKYEFSTIERKDALVVIYEINDLEVAERRQRTTELKRTLALVVAGFDENLKLKSS